MKKEIDIDLLHDFLYYLSFNYDINEGIDCLQHKEAIAKYVKITNCDHKLVEVADEYGTRYDTCSKCGKDF